MPLLPDLEPVTPHTALWRTYDQSVKAELFSTAISTADGTWLIDPIPLNPASFEQPGAANPIRGVIITNQNHWRASLAVSQRLSVPIFAHPDAAEPSSKVEFLAIADGESVAPSLRVITVEGAAPGEIALLCDLDHGIIVMGDALINFEPYGFTLLPPKYCLDQRKMKTSLTRLLDHSFERMFFGHGFPLLANGRARLGALLKSA